MNIRLPQLVAMLLAVTFLSFASTLPARAGGKGNPAAPGSPTDLVNAVNALRASYGLAAYSVNPILMAAAQGHADYMAATGNVSHTGIGGTSVTDRLLSLGYPLAGDLSLGGFRSENITSGSEGMSAKEAVNRWTGDAPHLNTMISPDLTEIGAGVTINNGRVYFVIDCARPTDSGVPQPVGTAGSNSPAGPTLPPGVSGVIIPVVVVTPNADGDVIHEVKAGQSLWQLAISYDTKIDEIKRLNHLFDNEIYPGTKLLIKKGVYQPTAVPVLTNTVTSASSPTGLSAFTSSPADRMPASAPTAHGNTASSNSTLAIAIGIIAAAVLGGSVVAWWGAHNKQQ
jgi:uncharacterized protein YkwD/LysM repeat protein